MPEVDWTSPLYSSAELSCVNLARRGVCLNRKHRTISYALRLAGTRGYTKLLDYLFIGYYGHFDSQGSLPIMPLSFVGSA